MEAGFIDYLFVFLNDKGMPSLATTIKEGSRFRLLYDIVADLKIALKPAMYNELIENSFYYASPYLPIYGFMEKIKKWPMLCLTVMEWENEKIKEAFINCGSGYFKKKEVTEVLKQIDKFIVSLKHYRNA